MFKSVEPLFSGKLGSYPHRTFSLELKPDAKPFHAKPYAVPRAHLATFKEELDRLVSIGVLVPTGAFGVGGRAVSEVTAGSSEMRARFGGGPLGSAGNGMVGMV